MQYLLPGCRPVIATHLALLVKLDLENFHFRITHISPAESGIERFLCCSNKENSRICDVGYNRMGMISSRIWLERINIIKR